MRRLATAVLSSCLMLAPLLAAAQVNSLPSQPHLLVRGKAEREVLPDRFKLTIELEQKDAAPEAARSRVQADAATVLGLFKAQHALADSVEASSLSIEPSTRYVDGRQVFEGTQVSRTLSASFAKLEDVRAVLGGLKTSDHLEVSGIEPSFSNESKVRGELKRDAAAQTRVTAHNLADAYGVKLGGLYTISEVAPDFSYGIQAGSWAEPARAYAPAPAALDRVGNNDSKNLEQAESLEAGSITLTEYVYAIFLIAP
ncbi:SIMPL domain-containing protein [Stenotrophomonas sp. HITSZ_GD]|uniref:SIMPL domain-containing protein n=1 Tax=Stenotrophomonas sp. HITSZ_GD TaxID=3037248 RepID=UPI00240D8E9D|nr:SIMPL domain-containing protein [Stenotrophomonas sp. HITSZ_GD]MDG2526047.1 SIMPL domain-containing protein [Stenotrophomonas sp. HITSZ_GD]